MYSTYLLGNLVKDAFRDPALFAKVLGMPKLEPLIRDIDSLLVAVNSREMVDVQAFRAKCTVILDYFHDDEELNYNIMSPSIHMLLHHG